jgi:hypothetical protein
LEGDTIGIIDIIEFEIIIKTFATNFKSEGGIGRD